MIPYQGPTTVIDEGFDELPDMMELLEGIKHGHLNARAEGPEYTVWCDLYHEDFWGDYHARRRRRWRRDDPPYTPPRKLNIPTYEEWEKTHPEPPPPPKLCTPPSELERIRNGLVRLRESSATYNAYKNYDDQLRLMRERLGLTPDEFYHGRI